MQNVQILNARVNPVNIRGLGNVAAGATRSGVVNQITFDDDALAYLHRATKVGVAVRDSVSGFVPDGYNVVTAAETLAASDRFAAVTAASADYALGLMAANAVPANTIVYFFFESGGFTATITRAGSDTIDDGTTLALNTGTPVRRLKSDGVSAWTSV